MPSNTESIRRAPNVDRVTSLIALRMALVVLAITGCHPQEGTNAVNKLSDPQSSESGGSSAKNAGSTDDVASQPVAISAGAASPSRELATFGAGCFWCVEAVFQEVKGVHSVLPGYTGGRLKDPTYEQICTGMTGHAEVIQIEFDPTTVSFAELLEIFWKTHDPTTLNRQGNDEGTQYRSAVFYHTDEQRDLAANYKEKLNNFGAFQRPIVTEIVPFTKFYVAEEYHKNYYRTNPSAGYCAVVIRPKMDKFREVFRDKLKPSTSALPEGTQ